MAHFAKIENGLVTAVVVVDNEYEKDGQAYLNNLGITGTWVQTSYSASFGKKFAAIGDSYNNRTKEFKPAKPFESWTWDSGTWSWLPPTPRPDIQGIWNWDEASRSWVTN
jgi:hypothetical protein